MVTAKELGRHDNVNYCIQITKTDDAIYLPRLVFLFDPEIILECDDISKILMGIKFDFNPVKLMRQFVVGFIDGVNDKLKGGK